MPQKSDKTKENYIIQNQTKYYQKFLLLSIPDFAWYPI